MLIEGVPPAMIENAGKQAGMPVGPLSLNDEVGVDLGLKILKATKAQLGEAAIVPEQEALLVQHGREREGRLGRKNRKGFYDYPESAPKRLWPGLADLQATTPRTRDARHARSSSAASSSTQALEAARTVEEGVITDPREADVGSILGFGFAPFTGGALSYIDFMGAQDVRRTVPRTFRANTARASRRRRFCWTWRHGRHILRPGGAGAKDAA